MFVNVVSFLFFQTLASDLRRGPGSRIKGAEGQHTFSFLFILFFFPQIWFIQKQCKGQRELLYEAKIWASPVCKEDTFFDILVILMGAFGLRWICSDFGGVFEIWIKKNSACTLWEKLNDRKLVRGKENKNKCKKSSSFSIGWEMLCTHDFLWARVHHIENHDE